MQDILVSALIQGLYGKHIHIEPLEALKGLSPSIARKKPSNQLHSCWEILHHIVIWQEAIINAIKGEKVDWDDIEKNNNWPSEDRMQDDSDFVNLVTKFRTDLFEVEQLIKSRKLDDKIPFMENKSIVEELLILV